MPDRQGNRHIQRGMALARPAPMLYTFALILIIAWLLGLVSNYTLGGFIHVLLAVAIVMVVVRLIRGDKV